jgi:hypothetical protein
MMRGDKMGNRRKHWAGETHYTVCGQYAGWKPNGGWNRDVTKDKEKVTCKNCMRRMNNGTANNTTE